MPDQPATTATPARCTIYVAMLPEAWEPEERSAIARITAKYSSAEVRTYPKFKSKGARLVTVESAEYRELHPEGNGDFMPLPNAAGTDFEEGE